MVFWCLKSFFYFNILFDINLLLVFANFYLFVFIVFLFFMLYFWVNSKVLNGVGLLFSLL
ncbi:hypothetical protein AYY19_02855 [Photobacterium aquimaris]|nr:hypothetical protein AYY19_02855 [Photobacterium aquimaris]